MALGEVVAELEEKRDRMKAARERRMAGKDGGRDMRNVPATRERGMTRKMAEASRLVYMCITYMYVNADGLFFQTRHSLHIWFPRCDADDELFLLLIANQIMIAASVYKAC